MMIIDQTKIILPILIYFRESSRRIIPGGTMGKRGHVLEGVNGNGVAD